MLVHLEMSEVIFAGDQSGSANRSGLLASASIKLSNARAE
jgi:hypothetical protein